MLVAVLGGRLQGIEAAYLARKAGWQVVVVDKDQDAPAFGLADSCRIFDLRVKEKLLALLQEVQYVIPALENKIVLDIIAECALAAGVRVVYDQASYSLSSSKIESDKLFAGLGIPAPKPWPLCGFPVTVKPSAASGSENVFIVKNQEELDGLTQRFAEPCAWVKQEFLAGPSFSIEVIGAGGAYRTFQVTELEIDGCYDCKRVLAPANLSGESMRQFADCGLTIARAIQLDGIMDVEVILHEGQLKVLEIDARLPSQTPTAVYKSTGINILKVLWAGLGEGMAADKDQFAAGKGVIYEHIKVTKERIEVCGEHILKNAGHLHLFANFFGAEEAISNYDGNKAEWVATLIITASDRHKACQQRDQVIRTLMATFGLKEYRDQGPPDS